MSHAPKFSIIVPTYNRREFVVKTLHSALAQTFADYEIIAVDDGSTDGSAEVIEREFQDKVRLFRIENGERGRARNYGTGQALGEYVYFLDSDDLLYPNHLEEAEKFLAAQGNLPWFFQEYDFIRGNRTVPVKYNRRDPVGDLVKKGNFMSCHGVFLRREVAIRHPFHEDRALAGSEDYLLWLQLAARHPLKTNPARTAALVEHDARSVFNFAPDKLIRRKEIMMEMVASDPEIRENFPEWIDAVRANSYSYLAIHLALVGAKRNSVKYLWKSLLLKPKGIFSRRTLAVVRRLVG